VGLQFNVWGGCPGVDCCESGNCASCCFNPPTPRFPDACVYTNNHTVGKLSGSLHQHINHRMANAVAYTTPDFVNWTPLGTVLFGRKTGIEFRPQACSRIA
jgi:hypothetical protein